MFGFLTGLNPCCDRAAAAYRSHFCGLGTALHRHHGARARCLVNRDSTSLALLGTALAKEPPATISTTCCSPLAAPRLMLADSPVLQYTSSITLCALAAKLDDDACDERGWRRAAARVGRRALDEPLAAALGHLYAVNFPVGAVRAAMAVQGRAESPSATLEECSSSTKTAFGEITAYLASVAGVPEQSWNNSIDS